MPRADRVPAHFGKLELPPRKIAWFHPPELVRTGFRVLAAKVATGFLDRRETLATLSPTRRFFKIDLEHYARDGVWIDFVSDVGDSWEATHAVASMVAKPGLEVQGHSWEATYATAPDLPKLWLEGQCPDSVLPHANIVVVGGDLVYPSATRDRYRRRMRSAFETAFPRPNGGSRRYMLAIPGNHDWYDGLTNFVREFCQFGHLGGWRLIQRRSYFAYKLVERWWLWGIDIALDTRIDPPQLEFFQGILTNRHASNDAGRFRAGDNIILCTAKPAWLKTSRYSSDAYKNLAFFVKEVVEPQQGRVPLILTGDLHHYSRYSSDDGQHMITAGGGGAYLMGTHHLPDQVHALESPEPHEYQRRTRKYYRGAEFPYPSRADSRRLAMRALLLGLRPVNWLFCLLIGGVYWWLIDGLQHAIPEMSQLSLGRLLRAPGPLPIDTFALTPLVFSMIACILFTLIANDRRALMSRVAMAAWGLAHGAAHIALALFLAWWIASNIPRVEMAALAAIAAGGLAGPTLLGAFLIVSDRLFGWHQNEVFAATSIIDYRNFIRMYIEPDGQSLVLFPIGLRRVPRKWRSRLERNDESAPFYEPVDDVVEPHLIEGPIRVQAAPAP